MYEQSKRLLKIIQDAKISYAELEQKTGIAKSSIQRYATGKTKKIPIDAVKLIADATNSSAAWVMGWENSTENTQQISFENIPGARAVTVKSIPLFAGISCGEPIYASEDIKCYIPVGEDIEADFCVVANGDSMTGARINDGDIVFIKKVDNINNGEIAAVWIDGDGALLKRIYIQDGVMSLVSENPKYAPRVYSGDRAQEVRLLGKAIAFQSSIE